mmetsp:Transcript_36708/g.105866  ORF Transcript_36708/g.105866 Transcript_36708/m.105866 type:complete len:260 (-) Transcript_36708:921-1700(-)
MRRSCSLWSATEGHSEDRLASRDARSCVLTEGFLPTPPLVEDALLSCRPTASSGDDAGRRPAAAESRLGGGGGADPSALGVLGCSVRLRKASGPARAASAAMRSAMVDPGGVFGLVPEAALTPTAADKSAPDEERLLSGPPCGGVSGDGAPEAVEAQGDSAMEINEQGGLSPARCAMYSASVALANDGKWNAARADCASAMNCSKIISWAGREGSKPCSILRVCLRKTGNSTGLPSGSKFILNMAENFSRTAALSAPLP